jgi:hypothetical protein
VRIKIGLLSLYMSLSIVGGVSDSVASTSQGDVKEPPSLRRLGRYVPARPLARTGGRAEDKARAAIDWEPGARVRSQVPSRGLGRARVSPDLYPEGIAPERFWRDRSGGPLIGNLSCRT